MVAINVGKPQLGVVRCFLCFIGSDKTLGDREHGYDGENLIAAVVFTAGYQHLGQLRVQGELGHDGSELSQVAVIIQGRQVVEKLQSSHQSLWCWGVHEVEMNQIIDTKLLELNDDSAKVRPQ